MEARGRTQKQTKPGVDRAAAAAAALTGAGAQKRARCGLLRRCVVEVYKNVASLSLINNKSIVAASGSDGAPAIVCADGGRVGDTLLAKLANPVPRLH
ncbi:hypothetical protein EVAR_18976_1 [Eumeta japonica]|uniref:Uncharacterized protein n=1 Tax=Eumeta variegata TaxID=151549 RepID=A0A4C1X074_EUMVA|nr:hypothetical protein EVAR_18976_1 [Eumeta japonica]